MPNMDWGTLIVGIVIATVALGFVGVSLELYDDAVGWQTPFKAGAAGVDRIAALGQFGDYLGGTLNPILSFLSLMAVLVTLGVQSRQLAMSRQELHMSREELRLTRAEMARAAEAQERLAAESERTAAAQLAAAKAQQIAADTAVWQAKGAFLAAQAQVFGSELQVLQAALDHLARDVPPHEAQERFGGESMARVKALREALGRTSDAMSKLREPGLD